MRAKDGNRRALVSNPTGPYEASSRRTAVAALGGKSIKEICAQDDADGEPWAEAIRTVDEVDRHSVQELLASGERRDIPRPISMPHHDENNDELFQGQGNSPGSAAARRSKRKRSKGLPKAGRRLWRLVISMAPNLRWVLTLMEMLDQRGVPLAVQPSWQDRLAACGIFCGERDSQLASGMPGYADFYLCAPGARARIAGGASTFAEELVWRTWRGCGTVVAMSAQSASSGCQHGGSSQVPPLIADAV